MNASKIRKYLMNVHEHVDTIYKSHIRMLAINYEEIETNLYNNSRFILSFHLAAYFGQSIWSFVTNTVL